MNEKLDKLKRIAAEDAVKSIQSGMILGLGTGSTTNFALKKISQLLKSGELENIAGIPSSIQTEKLAKELEIPLSDFASNPIIDLTIDGADEVDPNLNLIKGGGGALLREKILAQASRKEIIIVDEGKLSPHLGTKWHVPVEVIPFATESEKIFLESIGAEVKIRRTANGSNFITDEKNFILDADFGPIENPHQLAQKLNGRAGIVEHGLFIDLVQEVIVAGESGIRKMTK